MVDADVNVDAPDHHLPSPPLGAVEQAVVALVGRDLLVVPLRERMRPRAHQLDPQRVDDAADEPDELLEVGDRRRNRAVHGAHELDGVQKELVGDLRMLAAVRRPELPEHVLGDVHEVAGGPVHQRQLPLHADGGAFGFREFDLHQGRPVIRFFKGRQYLTE